MSNAIPLLALLPFVVTLPWSTLSVLLFPVIVASLDQSVPIRKLFSPVCSILIVLLSPSTFSLIPLPVAVLAVLIIVV
jgi:hypothetical protein